MKKLITILLFAGVVVLSGCSASSFATVGNNGWKVTLFHYSPDVRIKENGRDCTMVKAYAGHQKAGYAAYSSGIGASGGYLLYTDGIQLDKTVASHTVTIIKGGKTATIVIDRKSLPFIDVTAALGETKTMSMGDLQQEYIKQQKKKKK